MRLILQNKNKRREINTAFKFYGKREDFIILRDALNRAIEMGLDPGWVEVGTEGTPPDEKIYDWAEGADELPVFPWKKKQGGSP